MNRFTRYLKEDFDPAIYNSDGAVSIDDETVVDAINANLEASTARPFRTPYIAFEEVRKVLSYYKIFLPNSVFLDKNDGYDVFEVSQFGEKMGMNNQGEVVTANDSPMFVYFEWSLDENGCYDVFTSLVNDEELEEIISDFDAEVEDDETDLHEQHSAAHLSKTIYRLINQRLAVKHDDEAEDFEEEGDKSPKQMNEMPMPDLKKKMDSKKVVLSNRLEELHKMKRDKKTLERLKNKVYTDHDELWDKTIEARKNKDTEEVARLNARRAAKGRTYERADKASKKK